MRGGKLDEEDLCIEFQANEFLNVEQRDAMGEGIEDKRIYLKGTMNIMSYVSYLIMVIAEQVGMLRYPYFLLVKLKLLYNSCVGALDLFYCHVIWKIFLHMAHNVGYYVLIGVV